MDYRNNKTKILAIFLTILTIIVIVVSVLNSKKSEQLSTPKVVDNYSDFYTVNSCLYRVITYLSDDDKESMMLVLNEKYKAKNNIKQSNIMSLFTEVDQNATFISQKMYYQNISNNIKKYYVYGIIKHNGLYENETTYEDSSKDMYFIVYLDYEQGLFSIEPYSGEIFKGGSINEK